MAIGFDEVDELAVNATRVLAIDMVERARSGHPGAAMALAPVAYLLFNRILRHDPADPAWPDRDRFVLSCGHASALLYATLHLSGYALDRSDLEAFRQWGSRTAGHPELGLAPGVELTTGPLGQGCATSVGLALAEAHLAARFNRPPHRLVGHRTVVLCSDGDLMEGVSQEAASLAGHLGLGGLLWIWDDNRITIEGSTALTFSEDVPARFAALGWHVQRVDDANDLAALTSALEATEGDPRPSLVAVRSHIAFGAPTKHDTAAAHGAPLGEEEARGAKRAYGWPEVAPFEVPQAVRERCRSAVARGAALHEEWRARRAAFAEEHPELAAEWDRRQRGTPPEGWRERLPVFAPDAKGRATRVASGEVLNALADVIPELVGGSADLAPSCKTLIASSGDLAAGAWGERNLRFGIREHAMGATLNGLALHGGVRPFGSTFLVFSDYMRPAIRLASLMAQPVVYVFTHDSIWVGEDGPTHQPVEHLLALRAMPGLVVIRPADANETAAAWAFAVEHDGGPVALVLTRQSVPTLAATATLASDGVARGAYLLEGPEEPELVLVASGSEVALALSARARLASNGVEAAVVSMPSWELFDRQPAAYREAVLPPALPRLAVEAGVGRGWREYVGDRGRVVSIDRFGASAPGAVVAERLGQTEAAVTEAALALLGRARVEER